MSYSYSDVPSVLRRLMGRSGRRRSRSTIARRNRQRVLKKWSWDVNDMDKRKMEQSSKDVFLGASDVSDFIVSELHFLRNEEKLETYHREVTVLAHRTEWAAFMLSGDRVYRIVQMSGTSGILVDDQNIS